MGLEHSSVPANLPVTEDLSARLVRLPCFYELSVANQFHIIDCIKEFFRARARAR